MDRPIKRRDFLNGVAVAIGASFAGSKIGVPASQRRPRPPYPPALTGMRGLYPGSFTTAHALRDHTFWNHADKPSDTGERYDLVIVGGGISGLSAAYFYRKAAGDNARILILDVLDDFGGHAKRNEFDVNGRKLLGYGGTYAIESPSPYSPIAKSVIDDLGIDVTADRASAGPQALSVARHGPRRFLRQRNLWRRPAAARSQTGEGRRFWRSRHF
jgi:spermidine dehydrogenase